MIVIEGDVEDNKVFVVVCVCLLNVSECNVSVSVWNVVLMNVIVL